MFPLPSLTRASAGRVGTTLAGCVLVLGALGACGGGDGGEGSSSDDEPAASTGGSGAQASGGSDVCALLTAAEAQEALGGTVGASEKPVPNTCRYTSQQGQALSTLVIMVQRLGSASQARAALQGATSSLSPQQQSGIGDAAVYLPGGEQLHVVKDGTYFVVGGDVTLEEARGLAQKVIGRLN